MKVTLSKHLAGSEQVVVELEGAECADPEAMAKGFRIMDDRLLEMNRRILVLNAAYKGIVQEHPKAALIMNECIQVLVGERVLEPGIVAEAQALVDEQVAKAKAAA